MLNGFEGTFVACARAGDEKRVANVRSIVDTKASSQLQSNARYQINGKAPAFHETANVNLVLFLWKMINSLRWRPITFTYQSENDTREDPETNLRMHDQNGGANHDTAKCQHDIALYFGVDNLGEEKIK